MHKEEKVIFSTLLKRRSSIEHARSHYVSVLSSLVLFFYFRAAAVAVARMATYHCTDNGTIVHARTHFATKTR